MEVHMTEINEICSLSPEDLEARRKELRTGLVPMARGKEKLPDGIALFFDSTAEMRRELDAFVAFENQCCPGVGFSVQEVPGALRLEITTGSSGASLFANLGIDGVPSWVGPDQAGARGWLRLVRSAGLGAIGAFVLFCLVPIGLVAVLGAQLAAPFGALDNPWIIGSGALIFGGLLWRWERRREAARASTFGC
jgi:hypothetical protein